MSSPPSKASTFAIDPTLKYRRSETCHSSSCSASSVPTIRINESRVGKIPTTRVRRLISLGRLIRPQWEAFLGSVGRCHLLTSFGGGGQGRRVRRRDGRSEGLVRHRARRTSKEKDLCAGGG